MAHGRIDTRLSGDKRRGRTDDLELGAHVRALPGDLAFSTIGLHPLDVLLRCCRQQTLSRLVLTIVCPSDPNLVYIALHQQIFGVNVPAHRVEHSKAYELVNMPMPGCNIISWELPPNDGADAAAASLLHQEICVSCAWLREELEHVKGKLDNAPILPAGGTVAPEERQVTIVDWMMCIDTEFYSSDAPVPPWGTPSFVDEVLMAVIWSRLACPSRKLSAHPCANFEAMAKAQGAVRIGKAHHAAGAILNPAMTWVSSGSGVFVYLVNALTTAPLPNTSKQFVRLCKSFFPEYDIVEPEEQEDNGGSQSRSLTTPDQPIYPNAADQDRHHCGEEPSSSQGKHRA
ncbi:hypothetical protein HU200_026833 [Digitaria exilis]|uniref:Uncharacterized protein n=1 Tax=Digitaria exilis TaxID=1010633 RepID=A0A835C2Q3_9POAL|nr:hypothetical protein HU200_026833 [Digitaria exilis]CAB3464800.1 unnamed protein product [Digitaria exilis]